MTIIAPDFKTQKKSGVKHRCFSSRYIFKFERAWQDTPAGTLKQCGDCGKWWYLYQSSGDSRVWYKVRWYHTHYNERIIKEGGHIG